MFAFMHIFRGDSIFTSSSMELCWNGKTTRVVIKQEYCINLKFACLFSHIFVVVNLPHFRYFENPRPPVDVVFEEVSQLRAAIDRCLKIKS